MIPLLSPTTEKKLEISLICALSVMAVVMVCRVPITLGADVTPFCVEGREISTPNSHYCVVEKDGKEIKHGNYREMHANGAKKIVGAYDYGKKEGEWTYWDNKGKKFRIENYHQGQKHGLWKSWFWNGAQEFEGTFEQGKPVGTHMGWDQDGNKRVETVYTRQGSDIMAIRTGWYPNGQKSSLEPLKNGKLEGDFQQWHKNGEKRGNFVYSNSQRNGKCEEWYDNGQPKTLHHYQMGKRYGQSVEWYENGQKKYEGVYSDGKDGVWTYWNASGMINRQEKWKQGKLLE